MSSIAGLHKTSEILPQIPPPPGPEILPQLPPKPGPPPGADNMSPPSPKPTDTELYRYLWNKNGERGMLETFIIKVTTTSQG